MRIIGLAFVAIAFAGCGDKPSGSAGPYTNIGSSPAVRGNTGSSSQNGGEITEDSISGKMQRIEVLTPEEAEFLRRMISGSSLSPAEIDEAIELYQDLAEGKRSGRRPTPEALRKALRFAELGEKA